jgi:hypothetical protein
MGGEIVEREKEEYKEEDDDDFWPSLGNSVSLLKGGRFKGS